MPEFGIQQQILRTGFASLSDSWISGSLSLATGSLIFPDGTSQVTAGGGGGGTTPTGSLLTTASVNLNTITFRKGDGSTFPITVDTGSGGGGSTPTGSLLLTASFASPNITFTKGDSTTFAVNIAPLTSSLIQSSQTSSMSVASSSYALTASFATTASFMATSSLRNSAATYVVYTDYTAESTTSNSSTNTLTTFALTIADADWPLGGVLRLNGLMERTAGTGNVSFGILVNGSTARFITAAGQNMQWEWQIMKEAADTLRIGQGPSNTGNGSYQVHNASTVTATASGGNYVFEFRFWAVTAGGTATMRWMKGIMIP